MSTLHDPSLATESGGIFMGKNTGLRAPLCKLVLPCAQRLRSLRSRSEMKWEAGAKPALPLQR